MRSRPLLCVLILILLAAVNAAIVYAVVEPREKRLAVSFLDVGQGDAILIQSPNGAEVLVDSGRDRSILRELPGAVGLFDRSITMVIATHPDADHIGGLPDVFSRYRISYYLSPGIEHNTSQNAHLAERVEKESGLVSLAARSGQRIHLGHEVYADVLYPDRDVSKEETNAGSVVLRVVYGTTSFLLSGDAPEDVETYLVSRNVLLDSDIVKAGHHGSRTSTSAVWLRATTPREVVISAGRDNSYGHPHAEVVERIRQSGAELVSTLEEGTITYISDGTTIERR